MNKYIVQQWVEQKKEVARDRANLKEAAERVEKSEAALKETEADMAARLFFVDGPGERNILAQSDSRPLLIRISRTWPAKTIVVEALTTIDAE